MSNHLRKIQKIKIALVLLAAFAFLLTSIALPGRGFARLFQPVASAQTPGAVTSQGGVRDFAPLVKRLEPLVVHISTTQVVEVHRPSVHQLLPGDLFNGYRPGFFGGEFSQGRVRQRSLGSGFIINPDGLILTNNHVVDNAQKIMVRLSDGREFSGKVVGKDAQTDIALVRIDAKEQLPAASLGDSDRLEVGDWVLAIGNPFGLDDTVTAGIVSAIGRHIGAGPYDNFIQTDASINPGNSGGPLINLRGEIVGINSAIFSQSGENIGIGFATPINLAKEILPQLEAKGRVSRGWLGVSIQQVTPAIAGPLGMDQPRGALVADIAKDGPAARAGIKVGDVIVKFDRRDIKEASDLPLLVAQTMPEKQTRVTILRAKKEIPLFVTMGKLKEKETIASATEPGKLGMMVEQLTPQLAQSLGLSRGQGVILTFVEPGGPADDAGLRQGDLVLAIDHKSIRNLSDYRNGLAGTAADKNVPLLIRRGQESMFVALTPAAV